MADSKCPHCGHDVPPPGGFHGGDPWHSNRDCPNCKRPLIWYEGQPGWKADETEERRRKRP